MGKLSNTEAELKKALLVQKACISESLRFKFKFTEYDINSSREKSVKDIAASKEPDESIKHHLIKLLIKVTIKLV